MSKSNKILLIVAILLILIGSVIFVGALFGSNWDFTNLSQEEYETITTNINEGFTNILIHTDEAEVIFAPSNDGTCKVVFYKSENIEHSASVHNGALVIKLIDERKWYEHIGIYHVSPKITLYLPNTEYSKVSVECTTGGVNIQDISADSLNISVSTGDVKLTDVKCNGDIRINVSTGRATVTNVTCQSFFSIGDTGDLTMKNVIASGKISIERGTGDVRFDNCDAAEISVETDTGDVRGSLLSDKIFLIETDTGKVRVPKSDVGGRCEIETDTGDVIIEITNKSVE